ncbi:hypothetical protein BaOVIS_001830 [Babesia ovis]|uniref:Uncharacterized protein n=1 Tax=Babesia ovis TaxID=5869 RepID=A0A9W5TBP9_BABOV|nr:hypothetical protein BaOVIS_001830 [Babesia ovis]
MAINSKFFNLIWGFLSLQLVVNATVNTASEQTEGVENNVPWIFDTSKIVVPLVARTTQEKDDMNTYLTYLQEAKNLAVVTQTLLNITLPLSMHYNIYNTNIKCSAQVDESATYVKPLCQSIQHNDAYIRREAEALIHELKVIPQTKGVERPNGQKSVIIENLDSYINHIKSQGVKRLLYMRQLEDFGQYVVESRVLRSVPTTKLLDRNNDALITILGNAHKGLRIDGYDNISREAAIAQSYEDIDELDYEEWIKKKRNHLHVIAEFLTREETMAKENKLMNTSPQDYHEAVGIRSKWFDIFRIIDEQTRLIKDIMLYKNAVRELLARSDASQTLCSVSAFGMQIIRLSMKYRALPANVRDDIDRRMLEIVDSIKVKYGTDVSKTDGEMNEEVTDLFDVKSASTVDNVELSCINVHLHYEFDVIDDARGIVKEMVNEIREMKKEMKADMYIEGLDTYIDFADRRIRITDEEMMYTTVSIRKIDNEMTELVNDGYESAVEKERILYRCYRNMARLDALRELTLEYYSQAFFINWYNYEGMSRNKGPLKVPQVVMTHLYRITSAAQTSYNLYYEAYLKFVNRIENAEQRVSEVLQAASDPRGLTKTKYGNEVKRTYEKIMKILQYVGDVTGYKVGIHMYMGIIRFAIKNPTKVKFDKIFGEYWSNETVIYGSLFIGESIESLLLLEQKLVSALDAASQTSHSEDESMLDDDKIVDTLGDSNEDTPSNDSSALESTDEEDKEVAPSNEKGILATTGEYILKGGQLGGRFIITMYSTVIPKVLNTLLGTNVGKVSEEFDDGAKEVRIRKQELENSADLAQANDLSSATSADGSVTSTLPNGSLQDPTGLDIPGPIVTATGTPLSEGEPISRKSGDLMDSTKTDATGEAGPREARRTGLLKKLTEAAAAARAAIKATAAVPSDDFGEIDTDTEKTDSAGHVPALVGINLASVACILMMLA